MASVTARILRMRAGSRKSLGRSVTGVFRSFAVVPAPRRTRIDLHVVVRDAAAGTELDPITDLFAQLGDRFVLRLAPAPGVRELDRGRDPRAVMIVHEPSAIRRHLPPFGSAPHAAHPRTRSPRPSVVSRATLAQLRSKNRSTKRDTVKGRPRAPFEARGGLRTHRGRLPVETLLPSLRTAPIRQVDPPLPGA